MPRAGSLRKDPSLRGLSDRVLTWIDGRGWNKLYPIQEKVIPKLLTAFQGDDPSDFVISAPTATGKTEAVFIPLASILDQKTEPRPPGADILYICPLTALIDQQAGRLQDGLFDQSRFPVVPWHRSSKKKGKREFEENPRGVVIITPESLESQFINRPTVLAKFYKSLQCVVIDEFHAFFNNERGFQLLSQLSRLELIRDGRQLPRLALSATFDENTQKSIASRLRPVTSRPVEFLPDDKSKRELEFSVACFSPQPGPSEETVVESRDSQNKRAADQIFVDLGALGVSDSGEKRKALVFVNSRQDAEHFAKRLSERAKQEKSPLHFYLHHGSLSTEEKNAAIEAIRKPDEHSVIVCTTTLELGIDIGSIERVCQGDPGSSVSSLHQRLGRSGRRHGELSRLTVYVREPRSRARNSTLADLHLPTFQTLAQISLARLKAYEPPDSRPANLSTLLQQILSMAAQQGGWITRQDAQNWLVSRGPFEALRPYRDKDGHLHLMFARLEQADLLECQDRETHTYVLTSRARQLMEYYTFYAAFESGNDYNVYHGERHLGMMPVGSATRIGDRIIFANQLWTIMAIMRDTRTIRVTEATSGEAPVFPGDPIPPSQAVVSEMLRLYEREVDPDGISLEADAESFYRQGLDVYGALRAKGGTIIEESHGVLLFPWRDERGQSSLLYALRHWGLHATPAAVALFVDNVKEKDVIEVLKGLESGSLLCPEGHEAMRNASSVLVDKHDYLLSPYLQRWNAASRFVDMSEVRETARQLLEGQRRADRANSAPASGQLESLTPQASKDASKRRQTSSKSASIVRKRKS